MPSTDTMVPPPAEVRKHLRRACRCPRNTCGPARLDEFGSGRSISAASKVESEEQRRSHRRSTGIVGRGSIQESVALGSGVVG